MRALLWSLFLLPTLAVATDAPPASRSPPPNPSARYRLFPTQNLHIFLRLDTKSGLIDKVQWGTDVSNILMVPLFVPCIGLTGHDPGDHVGRYTLEPTQNIWEFLLLDQDTGSVWQIQWSVDGKSDLCLRIAFPTAPPPAATPDAPK